MRDIFGAIDDKFVESGTRNISHAELVLADIGLFEPSGWRREEWHSAPNGSVTDSVLAHGILFGYIRRSTKLRFDCGREETV